MNFYNIALEVCVITKCRWGVFTGKRRHRANSQERGNHGNDSGNKKRKHGSELHSKEKILKGRRQQWKKQAMEKSRGAKRQNKSKQRRGRT
jgi:hypothetical protein